MKVSMTDSTVIIEDLGNYPIRLSRNTAKQLATEILAAIDGKENYAMLRKGDTIWYADRDEQIVEQGVIFSVYEKNGEITTLAVEFPASNDFDEFEGSALGHSFFIDKDRAYDALKQLD